MSNILRNGPVPPIRLDDDDVKSEFLRKVEALSRECAGDIESETSGGMIGAFVDPETKKISSFSNFMGSGEELHTILRSVVARVNRMLVGFGATYHYHLEVNTTVDDVRDKS